MESCVSVWYAEFNALRDPDFDTIQLHVGYEPDVTTNARAPPIYASTSFVFDNSKVRKFLLVYLYLFSLYPLIYYIAWRRPLWSKVSAMSLRLRSICFDAGSLVGRGTC